MPFQIIRNDITKVTADAIVNTANPGPVIGGGTDSAIYKAAGEEQLLAERKKIGEIARGAAVHTPAFSLKAKYIIHTVGPMWIDGEHNERETLRSCYANSLALASKLNCESIAFPLIATGVYGFPKEDALNIAMEEIGKFLLTSEMNVILVVFDRKALKLSEKLVGDIDEYIDEHAVGRLRRREYEIDKDLYSARIQSISPEEDSLAEFETMPEERNVRDRRRLLEKQREFTMRDMDVFTAPMSAASKKKSSANPMIPSMIGKSLEKILNIREDTFQQRLLKLIDARGLDDVTVYKRANISRKLFSKIRSNKDYKPKKRTAVAFAIALHLDMPEMVDLLSRAEIAFSPSSKFDLIISYFVENKEYDIGKINIALFDYHQPLLGEASEI